jgi:hypothetical protein
VLILVACEFSGRVRDAFRAHGHDAVSCDLLPSLQPGPHIQGDVREVLWREWDMIIAFPPCTYLTNSNAWRWDAIAAERDQALDFVESIMDAPAPYVAVENPVGAIGTHIRKADQYIQPWHFGEPYQKTTGLWLKGLPKLQPEVTVKPADVKPWCQAGYGPRGSGTRSSRSRAPIGVARRVDERNLTFAGIARAMAEQWGSVDIRTDR